MSYTFLFSCENGDLPDYIDAIVEDIWPEPYRTYALEATKGDWSKGEVKLIVTDSDEDAMVCGLTGYFIDPSAPNDIYLRWTGVEKWVRCRGIASEALFILIDEIREKYPERKRLIELVPNNEYGTNVALPFFLSFGFKKDEAFVPSNESSDWECIPYVFNLKD